MGKVFEELDERLRDFIEAQHMFFVASAPSGDGGLVNLSPKGLDTFRILGPTRVAYLDFVGSGVETIAHLKQNGRLVVMFCAFDGPPRIVRLNGKGRALLPGEADFEAIRADFPDLPGVRSIIQLDVSRIADSCGFSVPLYSYEGERDQLLKWAERKGEKGLSEYVRDNNDKSLDGLPGITEAS